MKKRKATKRIIYIRCIILCIILYPLGLIQANTPKLLTKEKQKTTRILKGKIVSSEDNQSIIGANIWIKNTSTGTITDIDGHFSIRINSEGAILVVSYIGMKDKEVIITNQKDIKISLSPDNKVLDEVVIVGYGSQKKASVVGAISTVEVAKLQIPGSSLSNALAGQLSGIVAMTRSGEPGKNGAAEFYIRGVSSFKGSSQPLVLVDGIERDLDLVNPDDIATFSILKDASASAVYGVRGANGVIIITTRNGKKGKPSINIRTEAGMTMPTKMPKMMGSEKWAKLYNEAKGSPYFTEETIQKYRDGSDPELYPDVNWIDDLYEDAAYNQKVNLNISGGGDICTFFISGGYYNESSIFKNGGNKYDYDSSIHYDKINFRANLDFNLTNTTKLNMNLANIYEKSMGPGSKTSEIWNYTFATSPNAFPKEYTDGTISAPSTASGFNPWNLLVHSGYREQYWNSAQSLFGLTQDLNMITKGLKANVKFSWDAWNTSTQKRTKEPKQFHASERDDEGNLIYGTAIYEGNESLNYSKGSNSTMTTYMEASLKYNRLFLAKHRIGGLFLYNHKILTKLQANSQANSLPYKNQGIAARATYSYKDTYFAEFNMGYNGSENFARGHRFGFFPAYAAGWMASNEPWFEPFKKIVNDLKFKASYGKVGNDNIGGSRRWIYQPTINMDAGDWKYGKTNNQGGNGIAIGDVKNLNASWEEATKTNIGIEMKLFNAVKIQADYFHEKRTGIFLQRAGLPAIVGLSTIPYVNVGKAKNQGLDATVEFSKQIGEVYLTSRSNFTYSRNKLLDNDEPDWEYKYQNKIGKPYGSNGALQPFGLIAEGLFTSQEDIDRSPIQKFGEYRVGDIKYRDINGDGIVNNYDAIAVGYTNLPEIVYGFGVTAQWKNWDVNVFFQGVDHVSFQLSGSSIKSPFSSGNLERSAIQSDVYDHVWKTTNSKEENASVKYPRLSLGGEAGSSNNSQASTWWLKSGSFLRLKNFEVGYSLPKSLLNKTFVKKFRLYLSANNLLTFSQFKLWDPEQAKGSSDGSGYPPNRIIILGFNTTF